MSLTTTQRWWSLVKGPLIAVLSRPRCVHASAAAPRRRRRRRRPAVIAARSAGIVATCSSTCCAAARWRRSTASWMPSAIPIRSRFLRRLRERLVPAHVDLHDVGARAASAPRRRGLQLRDVARVRAPRRPRRVLGLEVHPVLGEVLERRAAQVHQRGERVTERRRRRRRRVRAAALARPHLDQPDRLQRPQRLTQRRPPDPELLAQPALARQPLAGRQATRV